MRRRKREPYKPMSDEARSALAGYSKVGRWTKRMGFRTRREFVQCLRAAALGNEEAAAELDQKWPQWREMPGHTAVRDQSELSTE